MTISFVQQLSPRFKPIADNIMNDIGWQVLLWQALVADIQQHYPEQQIWHRANLYQTFWSNYSKDIARKIYQRVLSCLAFPQCRQCFCPFCLH